MSLRKIPLRKLLQLFSATAKLQSQIIRDAVRREINSATPKSDGTKQGGGEFYGSFWADAKHHIFDGADLESAIEERILSNGRRKKLYPMLRDGFLSWWKNQKPRTNAPYKKGQAFKKQYSIKKIDALIKIDNVLSIKDDVGVERVIYPYFSAKPALSLGAARLGLWLLKESLPEVKPDNILILDIIRSRTFSTADINHDGNEETLITTMYEQILKIEDEINNEITHKKS